MSLQPNTNIKYDQLRVISIGNWSVKVNYGRKKKYIYYYSSLATKCTLKYNNMTVLSLK